MHILTYLPLRCGTIKKTDGAVGPTAPPSAWGRLWGRQAAWVSVLTGYSTQMPQNGSRVVRKDGEVPPVSEENTKCALTQHILPVLLLDGFS